MPDTGLSIKPSEIDYGRQFAVGSSNVLVMIDSVVVATAQSIMFRKIKPRNPIFGLGSTDPISFGDGTKTAFGRLVDAVIADSLVQRLIAVDKAKDNEASRKYKIVKYTDTNVAWKTLLDSYGSKIWEDLGWNVDDKIAGATESSVEFGVYRPITLEEFPTVDIIVLGMPENSNKYYKLVAHDVVFSVIRTDIVAGSPVVTQTIDFIAKRIDPWTEVSTEE